MIEDTLNYAEGYSERYIELENTYLYELDEILTTLDTLEPDEKVEAIRARVEAQKENYIRRNNDS